MKSFLVAAACICAILVVAAAGFIWSGFYDVAADVPHGKVVFWILEQTRNRSIAFHSRGIKPPSLNDKKLVHEAFPYFHAACRHCHGAPGQNRNEFAQGLYPNPPPLSLEEVQKSLSDAELFWVVKNGLKFTGMPAFKKIHTDKQTWSIIAFVRDLPNIYPWTYEAMLKASHKAGAAGKSVRP
ncbi:MAG: cytochrome c [Deltaproteobacteria bacterium]|jgi:mono/diheme cytochrome c family protein